MRPSLYDLRFEKPPPLTPRHRCFDVPERLDARGRVLLELDSYRGATVQAAARAAAALRRGSAQRTVERLFTILELRPRIGFTSAALA